MRMPGKEDGCLIYLCLKVLYIFTDGLMRMPGKEDGWTDAHAWERRWMFNLPVPESAVYFYLLATRNYLNCIFSRP